MKKLALGMMIFALIFTACAAGDEIPDIRRASYPEPIAGEWGQLASPEEPMDFDWADFDWMWMVTDDDIFRPVIENPRPPMDFTGIDVLDITDRLFIAQVNNIYMNLEDYLGRVIRYEGLFRMGTFPPTGERFYYVMRFGPGCCGPDGEIGFEVAWPDNEWPEDVPYPFNFDWTQIVGVLGLYESGGIPILRLSLLELIILDERGQEFVTM